MKKKNVLFYLLAFLIPFLIVNIVFMRLGVSYFGDKNILISDMEAQYISLFNYFKNIFNGTESIFYSFNSGLGNAMMSTFAYYLASPLNLILLLFNTENLYYGVYFLVTLKLALAGLTMYIYLNRKINGKKIFTLMFSLMYSLMAFNINNYFNIMWLDGVIMLPLVLIGIDKMLEGKSSLFFGITLFITILSNYYIGYMVCIFAGIYILYEIILKYKKENKKELIKIFIRFCITGVLVTLMTAFLLLPGISELAVSSKSTHSIFSESWMMKNNLLDIFSRSFIGTQNWSNVINATLPNIYTGLIIIPLTFLYFSNKNITKKEKVLSALIILIFLISIVFNPINMIWHGFSLPQGFNYRFTFMFCLFLIIISYKSFNNLKDIKLRYYIIFFIIYILISLLVLLKIYIFYDEIYIYISIGIIALYLLILKNINKKDMIGILLLLICTELFFNMYSSLNDYPYHKKEIYDNNFTIVKKEVDGYKSSNKEFYRIGKDYTYTLNDSLLLSYKGINHFLSTTNSGVVKFLQKMGLTGFNLNLNYKNSNKLVDTLLGVKYVLSYDEILYYQLLEEQDSFIYQNKDALNLGYMVSNNVYKYKEQDINDYLYQNYILGLMTNPNNFYQKVNIISDNYNYTFDCDYETDYIYLVIDTNKYDGTVEIKNGFAIYKILDKDINLVKLPYTMKDAKFNFVLNKEHKYTDIKPKIEAYVLDEKLYQDALNELKDEQLEVKKVTNTKITGEINVNNPGTLFLTLPYDTNFKILVDNKEVKYNKVFDSFIGTYLKVGKHNIEIEYKTKYLKEGTIISISSFTIFVLYIIYQKKKKSIDNIV